MRASRFASRLAWRTVRRAPAASTLLAVMIALPLAALAVGLVQQSSSRDDPEVFVTTSVGAEASARVSFERLSPIRQDPAGERIAGARGADASHDVPPALTRYEAQVAGALGAKARLVRSVAVQVSLRSAHQATDPVSMEITAAGSGVLPFTMDGAWPTTSGEIALSRQTAERLTSSVGDTVTIADHAAGVKVRVTGVFDRGGDTAALMARSPVDDLVPQFTDDPRGYSWFVTSPTRITWAQVREVNLLGSSVTSRSVVDQGPARDALPAGGGSSRRSLVLAGAAGALAVLVSVPAFLVNAGRRRRDVALLSASGATRRQLLVVQAGIGALTGAVGAALGVALGVLVARALVTFGALPGALFMNVRWPQLVPLVVLGVVAGIMGAVIASAGVVRSPLAPAIADRGPEHLRPRARLARLLVLSGGLVIAAYGVTSGKNLTVGAGVVLTAIGLLLAVGPLLSVVVRHSGGLPLPARLGLRDAARHRRRTIPALLVVVVLSTIVAGASTYAQSAAVSGARQYAATVPFGSIELETAPLPGGDASTVAGRVPAMLDELQEILEPASIATVDSLEAPQGGADGAGGDAFLTVKGRRRAAVDFSTMVISDGSNAALLGFSDPSTVAAELRAGHLVVSNKKLVGRDGTTVLQSPGADAVSLPATYVPSPGRTSYLAGPPAIADTMGLGVRTAKAILIPPDGVSFTTKQADSARSIAIATLAPDATATVTVELGYQPDFTAQAISLLAAGVAVLGALLAWILTLLTARDQRFELRILGAVGATPRTIGTMSGTQSVTVTALGTLLGTAAGAVLAFLVVLAFSRSDTTWQLALPWGVLALLLLGAPLLGGIASGAVTWRRARRTTRSVDTRD